MEESSGTCFPDGWTGVRNSEASRVIYIIAHHTDNTVDPRPPPHMGTKSGPVMMHDARISDSKLNDDLCRTMVSTPSQRPTQVVKISYIDSALSRPRWSVTSHSPSLSRQLPSNLLRVA